MIGSPSPSRVRVELVVVPSRVCELVSRELLSLLLLERSPPSPIEQRSLRVL